MLQRAAPWERAHARVRASPAAAPAARAARTLCCRAGTAATKTGTNRWGCGTRTESPHPELSRKKAGDGARVSSAWEPHLHCPVAPPSIGHAHTSLIDAYWLQVTPLLTLPVPIGLSSTLSPEVSYWRGPHPLICCQTPPPAIWAPPPASFIHSASSAAGCLKTG